MKTKSIREKEYNKAWMRDYNKRPEVKKRYRLYSRTARRRKIMREYMKKYYKKNRKRLQEYQKKWYWKWRKNEQTENKE